MLFYPNGIVNRGSNPCREPSMDGSSFLALMLYAINGFAGFERSAFYAALVLMVSRMGAIQPGIENRALLFCRTAKLFALRFESMLGIRSRQRGNVNNLRVPDQLGVERLCFGTAGVRHEPAARNRRFTPRLGPPRWGELRFQHLLKHPQRVAAGYFRHVAFR